MYFFLRHGKYTRTYFAMYGMQSKQWSAGMACSLKKRIAGTVDYKVGNVRHAV